MSWKIPKARNANELNVVPFICTIEYSQYTSYTYAPTFSINCFDWMIDISIAKLNSRILKKVISIKYTNNDTFIILRFKSDTTIYQYGLISFEI